MRLVAARSVFLLALLALVAVAVTACGNGSDSTSGTTAAATGGGDNTPPAGGAPRDHPGTGDDTGSAPPGSPDGDGGSPIPAKLTVTWRAKPSAKQLRRSISCPDTSGPDAGACAALAGDHHLLELPAHRACTELYGGPEQAHITGTLDGAKVDETLTRTDGCQIARYTDAAALLPVGVTTPGAGAAPPVPGQAGAAGGGAPASPPPAPSGGGSGIAHVQ